MTTLTVLHSRAAGVHADALAWRLRNDRRYTVQTWPGSGCSPLLERRFAPAGSDVVVVLLDPALLADAELLRVVEQVAAAGRPMRAYAWDPGLPRRGLPPFVESLSIRVLVEGEWVAEIRTELGKMRGRSRSWAPLAAVAVLVSGLGAAGVAWHQGALSFERAFDVQALLAAQPPSTTTTTTPTPTTVSKPTTVTTPPPPAPPVAVVRHAHLDVASIDVGRTASMRLRYLQGGSFTMGAPAAPGVEAPLEPPHEASVSPFWIGETEVTQAQWMAVQRTNPSLCELGCGPELPVDQVSFGDALGFLDRLSLQHGLSPCHEKRDGAWALVDGACEGYRLPTEAEWEYAARAGSSTRFHFGDAYRAVCTYDNTSDLSVKGTYTWPTGICNDGQPRLAPVRSYAPSPWGLYDVHGNVSEWVWDRFGPYPTEPILDYRGPGTGALRVVRGGSFRRRPQGARSATREGLPPGARTVRVGLRVARSAPVAP